MMYDETVSYEIWYDAEGREVKYWDFPESYPLHSIVGIMRDWQRDRPDRSYFLVEKTTKRKRL